MLIGYELQMSLLGQIVPIRLHNRILGCNTLQPSVLEDDGETVFDVELKITQQSDGTLWFAHHENRPRHNVLIHVVYVVGFDLSSRVLLAVVFQGSKG